MLVAVLTGSTTAARPVSSPHQRMRTVIWKGTAPEYTNIRVMMGKCRMNMRTTDTCTVLKELKLKSSCVLKHLLVTTIRPRLRLRWAGDSIDQCFVCTCGMCGRTGQAVRVGPPAGAVLVRSSQVRSVVQCSQPDSGWRHSHPAPPSALTSILLKCGRSVRGSGHWAAVGPAAATDVAIVGVTSQSTVFERGGATATRDNRNDAVQALLPFTRARGSHVLSVCLL